MENQYIKEVDLEKIKYYKDESVDSVVVAGSYILNQCDDSVLEDILYHSARMLKDKGILFIQGTPFNLPNRIELLMDSLTFKYWVAIESNTQNNKTALPTSHAAVVVFTKGNREFKINKIRFPHKYCVFCNKPLKDWGGKSHLMNPLGCSLSDVWRSLPKLNNYLYISLPVLETLLKMIDIEDGKCLILPYEGIDFNGIIEDSSKELGSAFQHPISPVTNISSKIDHIYDNDNKSVNVVHQGDAIEILKKYPDSFVDLVFADPPYNLDKMYNLYNDGREEQKYLNWCNAWLKECIRVLKPTGSLYLLNLPKWAIKHAAFLNKYLYLQNWIVWDALSEPRGKIMPAHYALLFYTKHSTDFTLNYSKIKIDSPHFCLRLSCIKERRKQGIGQQLPLTDIWGDIHRIKHKKDRDQHPCQLPDKLMERIVLLSSNEGDIILDPLSGAGTTSLAAIKNNRNYIAIDIDEEYVNITREKINQLRDNGSIQRESQKKNVNATTKKALQLELKEIAQKLGRLPTKEDVSKMSKYDITLFEEGFPSWNKALRAAILEGYSSYEQQ